jgi:hypothetical protein
VGIQQLRDEGILKAESKDKANILGKQFESVFTQEDTSHIPVKSSLPYPSMPKIQVQRKGVEKLLQNINSNKAAGPDKLPDRVLKEMASEISTVLTHIFNQSLATGQLPKDWIQANIVPVYKKGDKTRAENYRTVSLTSIACKLLEHIVVSGVLKHTDKYKILSVFQHGFRSGHSCETQVLLTAHDLAAAHNRKSQVDMAILDFSKAFDKVPHERLLQKLYHYGIRGNTLAWMRSFLTLRTQSVTIEGEKSSPARVASGVPQGTVLGPMLFLLYINDLPDNIMSRVRLFADDCVLYREIHDPSDAVKLQEDLNTLQQWELTWLMEFNPAKCNVVRFSPTRKPILSDYYIHGTLLERTYTHRYLGVLFSEDFKWSNHIDELVKKGNRHLGFVRRNTRGLPRDFKQAAYKSLVRPHMEYCATVWDPHTKKDINRVEQVQRRAARFVNNDYRMTSSVTHMVSKLEWGTLAQRRMISRLTMVYRIIRGEVAIPREYFFTENKSRQLRNNNGIKLHRYKPRTDIDKYAFAQRSVPEWNSLPAHIVNSESTEKFRKLLTEYLSSQQSD